MLGPGEPPSTNGKTFRHLKSERFSHQYKISKKVKTNERFKVIREVKQKFLGDGDERRCADD